MDENKIQITEADRELARLAEVGFAEAFEIGETVELADGTYATVVEWVDLADGRYLVERATDGARVEIGLDDLAEVL